ncbi:hypothetical protein DE146DRAFT_733834 [Phaeosphaeria sp. MPI-PUGE-AT-0046c]|nr:hypothetical protein DE146DRAFT_733834 [Phaeosphaeria sp. MPI-PUGE-AT-0046c]
MNLTQFATGFNNLVLELAFSDNVYWIARIPYRTVDDNTETSLLSEMATMNIVRQHTSIPIPRIFEFEISDEEPFGYPRIGRLWCGKTADQPVEIIPMAWHHSPGPLETSLEYFYNQREGENLEIVALHPNNADWLTACWVLKTALAHTVIEDRVRGSFPLCHLDFHFGNLLFDDDYNLTGVIDWSNAQAAPIEQLSVCPELVIFPGLSEEKNRPIVEFRKLVIHFVKEMEDADAKEDGKREGKTTPLDQQQENVKQSPHLTPLSTYVASGSAELMHRQYMASPKGSLWAAKRVAKLMYEEHITWEQLKKDCEEAAIVEYFEGKCLRNGVKIRMKLDVEWILSR